VEKPSCEKWKQIEGFGGIYMISSYGRIWVKPCTRIRSDGTKANYISKFVGYYPEGNNYPTIVLCDPITRKRRHALIHILVAEAFLEPPLTSEHEINHKDGNKKNLQIENLEWVTSSNNRKHALSTGLCKSLITISNGSETLSLSEWSEKLKIPVQTLYSRYKIGNSIEAILNHNEARKVGGKRLSISRRKLAPKYKDGLSATDWAIKLGISRPAFIWRIKNLKDEEFIYKKGLIGKRKVKP